MNMSTISSVNNWHEYPMFIAVSEGSRAAKLPPMKTVGIEFQTSHEQSCREVNAIEHFVPCLSPVNTHNFIPAAARFAMA